MSFKVHEYKDRGTSRAQVEAFDFNQVISRQAPRPELKYVIPRGQHSKYYSWVPKSFSGIFKGKLFNFDYGFRYAVIKFYFLLQIYRNRLQDFNNGFNRFLKTSCGIKVESPNDMIKFQKNYHSYRQFFEFSYQIFKKNLTHVL